MGLGGEAGRLLVSDHVFAVPRRDKLCVHVTGLGTATCKVVLTCGVVRQAKGPAIRQVELHFTAGLVRHVLEPLRSE